MDIDVLKKYPFSVGHHTTNQYSCFPLILLCVNVEKALFNMNRLKNWLNELVITIFDTGGTPVSKIIIIHSTNS